MNEKEDKG